VALQDKTSASQTDVNTNWFTTRDIMNPHPRAKQWRHTFWDRKAILANVLSDAINNSHKFWAAVTERK